MECMRQYISELLDFIADMHTLTKLKVSTVHMRVRSVFCFFWMWTYSICAVSRATWRLVVSRCTRTLLGAIWKWDWHKWLPWRSAKAIIVITKPWFVICPGFITLRPPCSKGENDIWFALLKTTRVWTLSIRGRSDAMCIGQDYNYTEWLM